MSIEILTEPGAVARPIIPHVRGGVGFSYILLADNDIQSGCSGIALMNPRALDRIVTGSCLMSWKKRLGYRTKDSGSIIVYLSEALLLAASAGYSVLGVKGISHECFSIITDIHNSLTDERETHNVYIKLEKLLTNNLERILRHSAEITEFCDKIVDFLKDVEVKYGV